MHSQLITAGLEWISTNAVLVLIVASEVLIWGVIMLVFHSRRSARVRAELKSTLGALGLMVGILVPLTALVWLGEHGGRDLVGQIIIVALLAGAFYIGKNVQKNEPR